MWACCTWEFGAACRSRILPAVTAVRNEDWAHGWKQHFGIVRIGSRLVIKPTWEAFSPEAGDAVVDGVARGQHQDGAPDAAVAEAPADREAVEPGQHHVEHDRVVGDGVRHPERLLAAIGDVDGVALLAQAAREQARELRLVLDHEHTHPFIVAPRL